MTTEINAAPFYNMHQHEWNEPVVLPEGPIELYDPLEDGTWDLDADANFAVEFRGEYPDMMSAIRDLAGEPGRYMWSRPDSDRYLGFLNHCPGSVALIVY